eukprot:scaffold195916_cov34-Tisochrysis_lutea.AAC.1
MVLSCPPIPLQTPRRRPKKHARWRHGAAPAMLRLVGLLHVSCGDHEEREREEREGITRTHEERNCTESREEK